MAAAPPLACNADKNDFKAAILATAKDDDATALPTLRTTNAAAPDVAAKVRPKNEVRVAMAAACAATALPKARDTDAAAPAWAASAFDALRTRLAAGAVFAASARASAAIAARLATADEIACMVLLTCRRSNAAMPEPDTCKGLPVSRATEAVAVA